MPHSTNEHSTTPPTPPPFPRYGMTAVKSLAIGSVTAGAVLAAGHVAKQTLSESDNRRYGFLIKSAAGAVGAGAASAAAAAIERRVAGAVATAAATAALAAIVGGSSGTGMYSGFSTALGTPQTAYGYYLAQAIGAGSLAAIQSAVMDYKEVRNGELTV